MICSNGDSEFRMGSRTSRGVPEESGEYDSYKESGFRRFRKGSGIFNRVPERFRKVLEGSRSGTTYCMGIHMDQGGAATTWVCRTTLGPHGPIRLRKGEGVLLLVGLGVRPLSFRKGPSPSPLGIQLGGQEKGAGRPQP